MGFGLSGVLEPRIFFVVGDVGVLSQNRLFILGVDGQLLLFHHNLRLLLHQAGDGLDVGYRGKRKSRQ